MNFYVFDPGVHHVFPQKGDVAADAQLRPALPRALDDTMVATFTSVTKAPRELTCELSGVIQKISPSGRGTKGSCCPRQAEKEEEPTLPANVVPLRHRRDDSTDHHRRLQGPRERQTDGD